MGTATPTLGQTTATSETRVPVAFSGGHETDPRDRGRPVLLVAGALGVKPEVFRDAFSRVHPSPAGIPPSGERQRQNKAVLMATLGPLGITNERLDEVSNYYRYRPGSGELWPTHEASAYATVRNGQVVGFTVTDGGSGYSSEPQVSIAGVTGARPVVSLKFDKDFKQNGSVASIGLAGTPSAQK
jgi:hypothetical protein